LRGKRKSDIARSDPSILPCLEIAQNKVGFPKMEHPLVDITSRE